MKKHIRGILMLVVFMLGFMVLVWFANLHLIQTDTFAALTMKEMQSRDDIDLAFIGSSIVRDHFNVDLITKETGLTAFARHHRRNQRTLPYQCTRMDSHGRGALQFRHCQRRH